MKRALVALGLALAACGRGEGSSAPSPSNATPVASSATVAPANLPAFFDCLRERHFTALSAHRGGPAPGFAENAIPTFAHTLTLAPAILEVDIAATHDQRHGRG